ncbi:putative dolichyl pyrophosphate phosphatase [Leishmania major strain Friedlin]|uniref:Putative dolichyl pyrophosphate phosphatase n=1 Tax=Leishmania major TaxID=5664 RepID=Q4Q7R8_LEIMA|nr:putative dolichyl pyrophosphate phosphatase [Leishmania major strain Friedlin]CAG9578170.1 dolichyl_pyrophosphate_phosphatase_-_putative [Leishmania major strain Friedlin]CAJ05868.1 putative dolichyl pyrophosphate phosphatase [Leishmania major strain Friedlin]|eukprot:XP_001684630.1 putative dolichyl pyrophosphate phosphatase [Leishmania major strain Friedlin]
MLLLETARLVWGYTHLSAVEMRHGEGLALEHRQHAAALATTSETSVTSSEPPHWKLWAMTAVVYRQHDLLSKLFAISSIVPVAMMVLLAGLTSAPCRERRIPAMNLILYLILSVCLNVVLKAAVRSPRPAHPAAGMSYTTAYGMPSDHAQFMAGFSVYLMRCWARARRHRTGRRKSGHLQRRESASASAALPSTSSPYALAALLLLATLFIGAGRVYNGYHTVGQALVGWMVGIALAFACTTAHVQRGFTWVSEKVLVPAMLVCTFWTEAIC